MGRRPYASKVNEKSGAFKRNPQRRNKREPVAPRGRPTKPKHLDKIASTKWYSVWRMLEEMDMDSKTDADLVALYCETYSGYRQALENVKKTGQVLVNRKGQEVEVKRNPFSTELHRYADRLVRLFDQMGFCPSARAKQHREREPDDALNDLLTIRDVA